MVLFFFSLLGEDLDGIAQAIWRPVEAAIKEKTNWTKMKIKSWGQTTADRKVKEGEDKIKKLK